MENAKDIIARLGLVPHPEGGYYREVYRSPMAMVAEETGTPCSLGTTIFFLLPAGKFSALHKISFDEQWFFLDGNPISIFEIVGGKVKETILDRERPWHLVKGKTWFGSKPVKGEGYSLACCTVIPGFDLSDFKLANYEKMKSEFPELNDFLKEMCIG
jgi:predicted cupin superfamily sugar epimerase